VESPSYPGATAAAVAAGLHPIAVPLDGEGLRADELDAVLARTHARVVVLQPLHQNPTGISLSSRRAGELLEVARRHRAFIVEDDFARHLVHHDARPPAPPLVADDPDGVVVHIRSLTKATSPNLRVGALAGRGPVMARLRSALVIDTMFVPAPLQHTALEVVTSPGWRRSLGTLAKALRHRREVAADALAASMPDGARLQAPRGGYHLWVPLPPHADSRAFAAAALRLGVAVTPGDNYFPAGRGAPHVRLSYVAAPSPADVNEAIRRLAAVALEPAP